MNPQSTSHPEQRSRRWTRMAKRLFKAARSSLRIVSPFVWIVMTGAGNVSWVERGWCVNWTCALKGSGSWKGHLHVHVRVILCVCLCGGGWMPGICTHGSIVICAWLYLWFTYMQQCIMYCTIETYITVRVYPCEPIWKYLKLVQNEEPCRKVAGGICYIHIKPLISWWNLSSPWVDCCGNIFLFNQSDIKRSELEGWKTTCV